MLTWRSKIFGDTSTNFYGWILGGLIVICVSLVFITMAINMGALDSPTELALVAIYFVLMGNFCLSLQNYHARVSLALDKESDKRGKNKAEGKEA